MRTIGFAPWNAARDPVETVDGVAGSVHMKPLNRDIGGEVHTMCPTGSVLVCVCGGMQRREIVCEKIKKIIIESSRGVGPEA